MPLFVPSRVRQAFAWLFPALLLSALPGGPLSAQPTLLKDINRSPAGSLPDHFVEVNGALYFLGTSAAGRELHRTDGTAAGTTLVMDITPRADFTPSGRLGQLTALGKLIVLWKDDGMHGTELWKSDGTAAGTVMVKDINPGTGWSTLDQPATSRNTLFFMRRGVDYRQLWKSDGTAAGTLMVKEFAGLRDIFSTNLVEANGVLYFGLINGPGASDALWRSDGTEAGTYQVKDMVTGKQRAVINTLSRLVNSGGTLYFAYAGQGLWKSDGTEAGTVVVKSFATPNHSVDGQNIVPYPGGVYFAGIDGNGNELWRSDGTEAGTVLVKDITPGSGSSVPRHMTFLKGKLYFDITPSFNLSERQLWCSDGTAAGTQLVKAIPSGTIESSFQGWGVLNDHLYFGAADATHGFELWKSDGTVAGTALVSDIHTGSYGGSISGFVEIGGKLLFAALERGVSLDDANNGMVYQTDGTPGGTASVHRVNAANASARGYALTQVHPNLFFYVSGNGIYKSDGTSAGGSLVKSFSSNPTDLTHVNGTLYFVAQDGRNGEELWKTDGTPAGTVVVKDISPNQGFFYYSGLVGLNGLLFFRVDDGTHGMDLWRSDGTEAGTFLLRDFEGVGVSEGPSLPVFYKGEYYFAASDGVSGRELWKTNGTTAGTVRVAEIAEGAAGSDPLSLNVHQGTNTLYFTADDGVHGRELWRSDGTRDGTILVKDSNLAGSFRLSGQPAELGAALLFIADDGQSGRELWKTDGTAAGTVRIKDINPGPAGAFYTFDAFRLQPLNGAVYFTATDGIHGEELWRSDGTTTGTFMVVDLLPGLFGSSPGQFYGWNNSLYFIATDAARGRELWRYEPAALLTVFSTSPLCAGSTLSVPFDAGTQAFSSGNVFTAELSDASGSFEAPQSIGTLTATTPAPIAATLPATLPAGSGYRIRVRASSPALTGSDNGTNLAVAAPPAAAITVRGATLTASEGTAYRWFLDGSALASTTRTIEAQQTGIYAVEVTGTGGCTARSAAVNVQVTGLEPARAGQWQVFPNPGNGPVTVSLGGGNWGGARLTLVDARGKTVHAATVPPGPLGETLQLDLTPYAPGVYLLVLRQADRAAYRKIMKR